VRPARVRIDRAGRRPRHVRVPRRVLQRGVGPAGARGDHPREAPERTDRHGEAVIPEALRQVRGSGGVMASWAVISEQVVWISPLATGFTVVCERCAEDGETFASVQATLSLDHLRGT